MRRGDLRRAVRDRDSPAGHGSGGFMTTHEQPTPLTRYAGGSAGWDFRGDSRQAMDCRRLRIQVGVAMGFLRVFQSVQAMIWRVLTRFRAVSALRPEVVRCGFALILHA